MNDPYHLLLDQIFYGVFICDDGGHMYQSSSRHIV